MSQLLDDLKAAREWLSDESHWTKGAYMRSAKGRRVSYGSPLMASTCLIGAGIHVSGAESHWDARVERYAKALFDCTPRGRVPDFNDSPDTTHADILRVLDCAIEKAEATS